MYLRGLLRKDLTSWTVKEADGMEMLRTIGGDAPAISPVELTTDLERKIASKTAGRIRGLRVEAVGDGVILCGRTSTYYAKQLASQIALDEHGDLILTNSIEVV